MKFKTGDRVKFLNDVGEGTIVSFTDKNTALVSTSDGFDIPVLLSELVKIEDKSHSPEFREETHKEIEGGMNEFEPEDDKPIEDDEIAIAFTLDKKSSVIRAYLVNSSSYHLYYVVSINREGEELIQGHGRLEPDTKVSLGRIITTKVDEEMKISTGLLFYGNQFYRFIKPVNHLLKILPSAIYSGDALTENDYFEQDASVYTLYSFREKTEQKYGDKMLSGDLKELITLKEKKEEKKTSKKSIKQPEVEEVDLHIESLVDEYKNLDNGEILEIQMGRFKTALETAIIHKTRRIVFIHGVGNGKLKHEIRRTLDRQYPQLKYQDASFREYGYGATMVIIPV